MAGKAESLGLGRCKVCGAQVMWTTWGAHKVKADCSGNHDSKACGSRVILGVTHSENVKRELKGQGDDRTEPKPAEREHSEEPAIY